MHSFRNEFFTCLFKIQNVQVIQNDVIKCCKMMSSNVVLLHSNNCCVLQPAICEDLDLHVVIFSYKGELTYFFSTLLRDAPDIHRYPIAHTLKTHFQLERMWILEPSFSTLQTLLCTLALPNINYNCVVLFLSQMYRLFIYTFKYVFSHTIYRCNSYNTILLQKTLSWKSVSLAVFSCTADPMNAFSWWQKSVLIWLVSTYVVCERLLWCTSRFLAEQ